MAAAAAAAAEVSPTALATLGRRSHRGSRLSAALTHSLSLSLSAIENLFLCVGCVCCVGGDGGSASAIAFSRTSDCLPDSCSPPAAAAAPAPAPPAASPAAITRRIRPHICKKGDEHVVQERLTSRSPIKLWESSRRLRPSTVALQLLSFLTRQRRSLQQLKGFIRCCCLAKQRLIECPFM